MTVKKLLHPFFFLQMQLRELFKDGSFTEKLLFFLYGFSSLGLFLYSYTQVDLGLVITRVPSLYAIEKQFQYIGYFNRPLSAWLFVILIVIFFVLYLYLLQFVQKKKIKGRTLWSIIGIVTIILTFSYNAFSYDLFNYIFDAKILTHYHQNPYFHKALDYPQDPMLGFMHWTHRSYPYGPLWLALTIPISFIGANIFIITFFAYKILMSASFLVLIYYLIQTLQKDKKDTGTVILFALNPLVLFEILVSAHNDIVMLAFSTAAVYFLIQKKYWTSFILLFISIGIKYATIALLPAFFLFLFLHKQKKMLQNDTLFLLCFSLMLISLFFVTYRTNFQPWYLLYVLPFFPLLSKRIIRYLLILVSTGSIFLYTSFLATGDWHSPWYTVSEMLLFWITAISAIAGFCYTVYTMIRLVFLQRHKYV